MNMTLLASNAEWIAAGVNCKAAFSKQMAGLLYGPEETLQAWCWFRSGWVALRLVIVGEN